MKYIQHTFKFPAGDKGSWATATLVDLGGQLNTLHAMHMEGIKEELRKRAGSSGDTLSGRARVATISAVSSPFDKTDWKALAAELLSTLDENQRAELLEKYTSPGTPAKQKVLFK